jgi:hypothetical protein
MLCEFSALWTMNPISNGRGKVFGFRFVAGGVGQDEVVAEINWIT